MKKSDLIFNVLRLPVDFLMLLVAALTTYFFRTEILSAFRPVLFEFNLPLIKYIYLVLFVSLFFLGCYAISGLYSMRTQLRILDELLRILVASSAGIMIIIVYIFLRQELFNSRFLVLGGWLFAIFFVFLGRIFIRYIQSILVTKYNFSTSRALIIGNNHIAFKIIEFMNQNPEHGYRFISTIASPELIDIKLSIDKNNIDEIILTTTNINQEKINHLVNYCHEKHISFRFIPDIYTHSISNLNLDFFDGIPLIEIKRTSLEGWGRVIKRAIDIIGSVLGLIVLSPLFLIVSFLVKWETEGSVFVKLGRISGNKKIKLFKFRSMIQNAEDLKIYLAGFNERTDGPLFKMKDDPRITKIGRKIRKYRIDELPQLYNVFKGDISLVGPRPHQPDEIAKYKDNHKKVLSIKGGVTGLAQVSGSSNLSFDEEVALDSFYIDNWSLWLDLKIILRTIIKILSDKSAV